MGIEGPGGRASDRVRREWLRRVEAEYRSAALTQHFGLWLIQVAAPPELIHDALRIVSDEMTHAELSHATYVDAGGTTAPHLPRETLALLRSQGPLEQDVLRHGVEVFCLGETLAVRLFTRLRSGCIVPSARSALDRVLVDEVRHRDFGWSVLDWLLSAPSAGDARRLLAAELPIMLRRLRDGYVVLNEPASAPGVLNARPPFDEADRGWGLMSLGEYAEAVEETFQRDYTPRFTALEIEMPRLQP
jgi:hypothetical protein